LTLSAPRPSVPTDSGSAPRIEHGGLVVQRKGPMIRYAAGLLGVAGLVASALVAADARAGCERDSDCKAGRTCLEGKCIRGCSKDADCPGELVCQDGRCSGEQAAPAPTPTAAPTPTTAAPLPAATPPERTLPEGRCGADIDCATTQTCEDSVCVPREEMRNPAMLVSGIVLMGAGLVGALVGVGLVVGGIDAKDSDPCYCAPGSPCYADCPTPCKDCENDKSMQTGGAVAIAISGAALILGAILTPVGATKVPLENENAKTGATLEPLIGPMSAGVRVTF